MDELATGLKNDSSLPWEDLFFADLIFSTAYIRKSQRINDRTCMVTTKYE